MALFAYSERLSEVLKRGEVYFPGESVKKFGLQIANIEPVMVADGVSFEWGELVVLDTDGRAAKVSGTTTAADIVMLQRLTLFFLNKYSKWLHV